MLPSVKDWFQFGACEVLRPVLRRLPAGRVRLLGLLGGGQNNAAWIAHPHRNRVFWDADLKAWIEVDLGDWGGRWHYFSGQYYDRSLPWIMQQCLGSGDTFIDIGANFGIHSVRAAHLVADSGKVFSLEPSPPALRRLQLHIVLNRLENVEVLPIALGAEEGETVLRIDPAHLGTASLRQSFPGTNEVRVRLTTLDACVNQPEAKRRTLIKIDVEGFELNVVRGARRWLERTNTVFVVEVTPEWIKSIGGRPRDLFSEFQQRSYQAFQIRRGGVRYREAPLFVRVDTAGEQQADYLFVRREELASLPTLDARILGER